MVRASASRDMVAAILIVGGVLVGVYLWSGVWPPLVVIESSSMMHPLPEVTPYGKVGTIDPGDMVFVKALDLNANGRRGDVELWDDPKATKDRYGRTGDVIVFYRDGQRTINGAPATPIIHRAIGWVEVKCPVNLDPVTATCRDNNRTFEVTYRGQILKFSNASAGITMSELGLNGYKPVNSGYLTKGDNRVTNQFADQAGLANQPSRPEWVTGKARGEVPWFGLIKLAIGEDLKNSPTRDVTATFWVRVGNVYAPSDLWVMLLCSVLAIIVIPLGWDVWRAARDRRDAELAFEAVRMQAPPRPRVRPVPPPGPGEAGGRRMTRFEIVRPGGGRD